MRRLALLLIAVLLGAAGPAKAQFQSLSWATAAAACAGGFTGVGDLAIGGAVGFYGLRAFSCAAAGSNAIDIIRASDSATCTVKTKSSGDLDIATGTPCSGATVTSFCTATTCTISKWYEQSAGGGGAVTQATVANQATLSFNCVNTTLPCALFGTNTVYVSATAMSSANTATFGLVFNDAAGGTGTQRNLIGFTTSTYQLRLSGGIGSLFCSPDTSNLNAVSASTWHTGLAVCAALSGTYVDYVDNSSLTGGAATGGGFSGEVINFGQGGGSGNNDKITEAYVFTGAAGLTSGNATSICHNERLYWGTSGSC